MVAWLSVCRLAYGRADATATYLYLASVESRLVLPFWYRLTQAVPEKGLSNVVCVCVCDQRILTKGRIKGGTPKDARSPGDPAPT